MDSSSPARLFEDRKRNENHRNVIKVSLLEEANSRRYLTIPVSSDYDAHGICSSFLVLGEPPRADMETI